MQRINNTLKQQKTERSLKPTFETSYPKFELLKDASAEQSRPIILRFKEPKINNWKINNDRILKVGYCGIALKRIYNVLVGYMYTNQPSLMLT